MICSWCWARNAKVINFHQKATTWRWMELFGRVSLRKCSVSVLLVFLLQIWYQVSYIFYINLNSCCLHFNRRSGYLPTFNCGVATLFWLWKIVRKFCTLISNTQFINCDPCCCIFRSCDNSITEAPIFVGIYSKTGITKKYKFYDESPSIPLYVKL